MVQTTLSAVAPYLASRLTCACSLHAMPTHLKVHNPSVADPGPPKFYKPVKKYRSEEISLDIPIAWAEAQNHSLSS
jgi:hypothetical protein